MRKLTILLGLSLIATGLAVAQVEAATPKAGTTCTKLNQAQVSGGYTYTCIKSGKKLVWSKGVRVAVPTPTPSPTSSASPIAVSTPSPTPTPEPLATPTPSQVATPSLTPTPSVSPVPPAPKTFDDLIAHPESISYWAWKKSSDQIKNSNATPPTVDIHLGPNVSSKTMPTAEMIGNVTKLYEGFAHPNVAVVIDYNFADVNWAQKEFAKYAYRPVGVEASRQCSSDSQCMGALAEIDLKGVGLILETVPSSTSNWPDPVTTNHIKGLTDAHEYTHDIQGSQFVGTAKEINSYCCTKAYLPWWMVEGNATFSEQIAGYYLNFDQYLTARNFGDNFVISNVNKQFTQAWFENYLDTSKTTEWNKSENSDRMYDIGQMVNEIFASIKGPSVNMQLFKDVANGKTWEQAFEANLGVPWSEGLPKIATILAEMVGH